jgi:hypothetical protein
MLSCFDLFAQADKETIRSRIAETKCLISKVRPDCPNTKKWLQGELAMWECALTRGLGACKNNVPVGREEACFPFCSSSEYMQQASQNSEVDKKNTDYDKKKAEYEKQKSQSSIDVAKKEQELQREKGEVQKLIGKTSTSSNVWQAKTPVGIQELFAETNTDYKDMIALLPDQCKWSKYNSSITSGKVGGGTRCFTDKERGYPVGVMVANSSTKKMAIQICLEIFDIHTQQQGMKCEVYYLDPGQTQKMTYCDGTGEYTVNALPTEYYNEQCKSCFFPNEALSIHNALKKYKIEDIEYDKKKLIKMPYKIKPLRADLCAKEIKFQLAYRLKNMSVRYIRNGLVQHPIITGKKLLQVSINPSPELAAILKTNGKNFSQYFEGCRTYLDDDEYPGREKEIVYEFSTPIFELESVADPQRAFNIKIESDINEFDEYEGDNRLVASDKKGVDIRAKLEATGDFTEFDIPGCFHDPKCKEEYQIVNAELQFINSSYSKLIFPVQTGPLSARWVEGKEGNYFYGPSDHLRMVTPTGCLNCGGGVYYKYLYPIEPGSIQRQALKVNVYKGVPNKFPVDLGYFTSDYNYFSFSYESPGKTPHSFVVGCKKTGVTGKGTGSYGLDQAYTQAMDAHAENAELLFRSSNKAFVAIAKGKDDKGEYHFVIKDSQKSMDDARDMATKELKKLGIIAKNTITVEDFDATQ